MMKYTFSLSGKTESGTSPSKARTKRKLNSASICKTRQDGSVSLPSCSLLFRLFYDLTILINTIGERNTEDYSNGRRNCVSCAGCRDGKHKDNSKYKTKNIVAVTYGTYNDKGEKVAYKTILLNYNNYSVRIAYNGMEYTIPAYEYAVINLTK